MSNPARYRVRVIIHELGDDKPFEVFNEQTYAADRKDVTELLELAASNAYAALAPPETPQSFDARLAAAEAMMAEIKREVAELNQSKMDRVRASSGWFDPYRAFPRLATQPLCKIPGCFCQGRAHAGHAPRTEDAAR